MLSLNIRFRKSTKNGHHPGRLIFRVIHQRKTTEVVSSFRIYAEEWDKDKNCICYPTDNAVRKKQLEKINKDLIAEKQELSGQFRHMMTTGNFELNKVSGINKLRTSNNSFCLFTDFLCKEHQSKDRFRTARAYESVKRKLLKHNKEVDFSLDCINANFVKNFEAKLKAENLASNTTSFYLRNLRSIYNKAVELGRIEPLGINIFKGTFTGVEVTKKRALTQDELRALNAVDLSLHTEPEVKVDPEHSNLHLARDLFNFSFLTRGMSFVDLAFLKKEDIKNNTICYSRHKTKQKLEITLTTPLLQIINKYIRLSAASAFLFPIIKGGTTHQQYQDYVSGLVKQNKALKILANLSGISKKVSTHVSRHTWATIAKKQDVPLWTISEALGHTSLKTTSIYLDSFDASRLNAANKLVYQSVGF